MAVIQDITATDSMRKAIQQEQERYYFLVEQSPEAILLTREGEITYVNQAAIRLFGAEKAEDLIGRTSTSLATSDFHQLIDERRSILLGEGRPVPLVEEKIIRLDGSTCDVEVATVALGDLDEKAIQVTLRDITERKRAQEQLKEQLLELRRWHAVTLEREQRVLDLKAEINDLLVKAGEDPRYQVAS